MAIGFNIVVLVVLFILIMISWWNLFFYGLGMTYCSFTECIWQYSWWGGFIRTIIFIIIAIVFVIMIQFTLYGAVKSVVDVFKTEKFSNNNEKKDKK